MDQGDYVAEIEGTTIPGNADYYEIAAHTSNNHRFCRSLLVVVLPIDWKSGNLTASAV